MRVKAKKDIDAGFFSIEFKFLEKMLLGLW